MQFEWDAQKENTNLEKHGVDFVAASRVFDDQYAVIKKDVRHSLAEDRFYIVGKVDGKTLTVRFTIRGESIRIFGAGLGDWTK